MKSSGKNLIQPNSCWLRISTFCLLIIATSAVSAGTLVRVATSIGNYHIELLDEIAPNTVANFLGYLERGDYNQTYLHRTARDPLTGISVALQGGAYRFEPFVGPIVVPTLDPIANEFIGVSNVRGTVAMAKAGGDLNSARNQWFINLIDNSDMFDRNVRIVYSVLGTNEMASVTFSGGITLTASTVESLADAINAHETLSTQWNATDFGNILVLADILEASLPVNGFVSAEITGGDGGVVSVTNDADYVVFGNVVEGMNVVDAISNFPTITLGTGLYSDNTPVGTTIYSDPSNFVYQNLEIVDRASDAINVFEGDRQLLMASIAVDGTEFAFAVNFDLVVENNKIMFEVNPDSIVQLHFTPQDVATFSGDDLRIRFPEIEVNNGGNIQVVENVHLLFTDFANLRFTLVSACQGC